MSSTGEVDLKVKYKEEILDFVDIPVDISNRDLLSQVVMDFCSPKLKLPEKKELNLVRRNYTLKKHQKKFGGDVIRGVLELGSDIQGKVESDESELKNRLKEMESKMEMMEKKLKQAEIEAATKSTENIKLKADLKKALDELEESKDTVWVSIAKTTQPDKEKKKRQPKKRELEPSVFSVPGSFKSHRGILVPQNVFFEVNKKYGSLLSNVFANGDKVARGTGGMFDYACFKMSTVFTTGRKYYVQVSALVEYGYNMEFGLLNGEVSQIDIGDHVKGWSYRCTAKGKTERPLRHNKIESGGYGPKRTNGKHNFGIFCDFTNGKGEVSFIVDGKNWGVAYRNVEPPVSPAFCVWSGGDSFMIEDTYEVSF